MSTNKACKCRSEAILTKAFNLSLKEGVVPFEWKEANLIPLFKNNIHGKNVIMLMYNTIVRPHLLNTSLETVS